MNTNSVVISTLEKLHARISELEIRIGNGGRIGTYICAGQELDKFADEIISLAETMFRNVDKMNEMDVGSVQRVKDLGDFIRTKKDDFGLSRLEHAITERLGSHSENFYASRMIHEIKLALMAAYGRTDNAHSQRSGRPAHSAGWN